MNHRSKIVAGSVAVFFAAIVAGPRGASAETVWLSSLDLGKMHQGFGQPQVDQSVDRHPLSIGGRTFDHGVGTHAPARLVVRLDGRAGTFHAVVGVDDDAGRRKGSVEFKIVGDGKTLWASGIRRGGQAPRTVDVDLTGVHELQLRVGDGGDGLDNDHADWADARFDVAGAKPQAVEWDPPEVVVSIATSRPSDAPELHAARVYGSRPGQPFQFPIAATGKPPLTFSADGLPEGLKLDAAAGVIAGTLLNPGTSDVTLRAANAAGAAEERIDVVGGPTLALTPPLGWNSYDAYGDNVTEEEIRANARVLADQLKPHGWQYAVVDYRWYDPGAHDNNANARAGADLTMDEYGRLVPSPNRFPSAAGGHGFKPLADEVHAMGLKFGIHVMRGIPRNAVKANLPVFGSAFHAADAADPHSTCAWCPDMFGVKGETPAGQAYYDSLLKLYADWGVDFIKVDDLSRPYAAAEVEAIRRSIDGCGRPIVFSTSPGATPLDRALHVRTHANQWRLTDDFWDGWKPLNDEFNVVASWNGHGGPGHWPDPDMLPLGRLSVAHRSVGPDRRAHFLKQEQVTLVTLWSIFPAPLMLGGTIVDADDWEVALLTNDEVLAVNQDPLGVPAARVSNRAGLEVWERDLADGSKAVALFNRTDDEDAVRATWGDLVLIGRYAVRDLWQRKDLSPAEGALEQRVPPHGAVLLRLTPAPH